MLYFIERETQEPFEGSIRECQINTKVYDIVPQGRNVGLDRISDHVINDTSWTFEKTDPREQQIIREFVEENFNKMNDLLLG